MKISAKQHMTKYINTARFESQQVQARLCDPIFKPIQVYTDYYNFLVGITRVMLLDEEVSERDMDLLLRYRTFIYSLKLDAMLWEGK